MKKLLLFIVAIVAALSASAQTQPQKYYLDLKKDNTRYYFDYNSSTGMYELSIPQLEGDFLIYNDLYTNGGSDQNHYIYGASTDNQSAGVTPDSEKKLANPGHNMSIEGGGIIYGAKLIFDPAGMTLKIVGGSKEPMTPLMSIIINSATGISPERGEVRYTISTAKVDNPQSLTYDVILTYTKASGEETTLDSQLTGTLTGSFNLPGLRIGSTTPVEISATTTYGDIPLSASAIGEVTTPEVPILIGQLTIGNWQPDKGIEGTKCEENEAGDTYYYYADFTDTGEFSFVTKLASSAKGWDTVNAHPRYAPAEKRVAAPDEEWMPYTRFDGSTENAWYPEQLPRAGQHTVFFSYARNAISVVSGVVSSVEEVETRNLGIEPVASGPVDVYTLQGILIRHNVNPSSATAGLPGGIYIVNGKKLAVR